MYRERLPQLDGGLFVTDGGIETDLIFHHGLELPAFAAFDLLKDEHGTEALRRYYAPYVELARERGLGLVLESPTWRANPDWATEIGYSLDELDGVQPEGDRFDGGALRRVRAGQPIVISGCVGPQSDGYRPTTMLTSDEAERYHSTQIGTFADTAADMVTAMTMTYAEEAIGVTRAAARHGLPVVISFTLETDGRLPSGQALGDAIQQVDDETDARPAYFMINCAHPTHFVDALDAGAPWVARIGSLRTNASMRKPRRAGRGDGARRRRPRRPRRPARGAEGAAAARERPGRLLRDRSPARLVDLLRLGLGSARRANLGQTRERPEPRDFSCYWVWSVTIPIVQITVFAVMSPNHKAIEELTRPQLRRWVARCASRLGPPW
jgi:S-methylmethionine-dependent homocysteine/selenocysteine methylase